MISMRIQGSETYKRVKGARRALKAAALTSVALVIARGLTSHSIAGQLHLSSVVAQEFPNQYFPENLPAASLARYFPNVWTTYGSNPGRNGVFSLADNAPSALEAGVHWAFPGAGAIPLDGPPLGDDFKTTAYTIGIPVGVSAVQGIIYAGDDNGYTYALNAVTGALIWAPYGWNMNMSNPLVEGDRVFVSTGNAYFNYANTMLYVEGKRVTRGPGLNTIYALDRKTGKELWAYHTPGEVMPTPVDVDGFLSVGTGDGHVYKLDSRTGKLVWKSDIQSFVSMSSPVAGVGLIFLGGTYPNYFYALDQKTGRIVWKLSLPHLVATGMGDCTPAFADGTVVQEATVQSGDPKAPVANVILAMDARTGKIVWQHRLGNGPTPPAMKTVTPMITGGVVYEGSPVTGNYYAFDLKSGRELWRVHLGSQIRTGAAVKDGVAYVPYRAGDIAAIRTSDGKILNVKHIGGAFGPSSPVIVGGTLYVSNIYGWVIALPVSEIRGSNR